MESTDTSSASPTISRDLALYYSDTCWFCARVRQVVSDLGLVLDLRNVDRDAGRRGELINGGGKGQVPCLRIETADGGVQWMYESADINDYLRRRFGKP